MPVSLDIVKKYSPVYRFHENERYFPCSIEHLLEGSTLHYRNFAFVTHIAGQSSSSTPAIAAFNGSLYILYQDSNGFGLYTSRSTDGNDWQDTQQVAGMEGGSPSLVVFEKKLWAVWHGVLSSQLWMANSSDGLHWSMLTEIVGPQAFETSITVFDNKLFMVYTHTSSSELWMSHSADGQTWSHPSRLDGQSGTHPSITTFKDAIVAVYVHPGLSNFSMLVTCFRGNSWTSPIVIPGQQGSRPALTTIGDAIFMTYSSGDSSQQLWATRSFDPAAVIWQDTMEITGQHGDNPSLCVLNDIVQMVYRNSTALCITSCPKGDLTVQPVIVQPTQATLQTHASASYYVLIDQAQFGGQSIPSAPLYYTVQETNVRIVISYQVLYAYQGGQTVRALRAGSEFDCILWTVGTHQGDFEWVTVTLKQNQGNYTVLEVGFAAHGIVKPFPPNQVTWEDTHAIVHIALTGHSSQNHNASKDPIVEFSQAGAVAIGSYVGSGQWWRPDTDGSQFRQLALDANGSPIGDQVWSAFGGWLGDTKINALESATYFDGSNLSAFDWAFVEIIFGSPSILNLIPSNLLTGDAPTGPAARRWIKG